MPGDPPITCSWGDLLGNEGRGGDDNPVEYDRGSAHRRLRELSGHRGEVGAARGP